MPILNKTLIASSIFGLFCGVAHADDGSSVTLYGILDVAVGDIEHSPNGNALFPPTVNPVSKVSTKFNQSVTGMFNGGISDPRWGIRGKEDLGGGLQAFFDLESGFNIPSGNLNNAAGSLAGTNNSAAGAAALNGQLFNRGAYVGLRQDQFGSVEFGRTTTIGYDTIASYDPLFAAQLFSQSAFPVPIPLAGSRKAPVLTTTSDTRIIPARSTTACPIAWVASLVSSAQGRPSARTSATRHMASAFRPSITVRAMKCTQAGSSVRTRWEVR